MEDVGGAVGDVTFFVNGKKVDYKGSNYIF